MRNIQATGQIYVQISQVAARKLFNSGIEIYLQSCKYYPFGVWQSATPIKLDKERLEYFPNEDQFSITYRNYQYYNCDNERGLYIHFYKAI